MKIMMRSAAFAACGLVSACGGGDGANATAAAPTGTAAASGSGALAGNWADADACATLDGRTVILSTRVELPVDNDVTITKFPEQERSMNMAPEAVPGIGKGAYWTPGDMPHLDFWIGQHQAAFFQFKGDAGTIVLKKEDEAWAKDLAIKLSHKIGG